MEHEAFVTTVMAVVALLFIAAVSAVVTQRIRFPYTIGLVVIGVAVAFVADDYPELAHALDVLKLEPVMIMFLFIPILIFESAFKMDVAVLTRNLVPALALAGPGLLISTAIIGGLIHLLTPLPLESALIFGCLISATDPVAVIALFKEVGAPKRLNILMEGESVFNDATAIVTFQIILAVIAMGILDAHTLIGGVADFFAVFFGGLLVGILFGWLVVRTIPWIGNQPLVHITLTLVTAYGAFIIAEHVLSASGIMAVLSAGLTIGYYGPTSYKPAVREYLEMFWADAAFVANSLIFLMLGLSEKVFLAHTHSNPEGLLYPVLIAIAVVMVARFAVVNTLVPALNLLPGATPIDRRYRLVMAWGGLRGAVAIALAMSLPSHFPYRWQIIDFTFGVTLFTLVVNGTSMSWVLRKQGLDKPSPVWAYLSGYAAVEAARGVLQRLREYRPVVPLSHADRARVLARHETRLLQAEQHLEALRAPLRASAATRRQLLWLQALAVQHKTYLRRLDAGLLLRPTQQALERDLLRRRTALEDSQHPIAGAHRLPSDRRFTLRLGWWLQGAAPRFPWLRRLHGRWIEALSEEASAVVAAAQDVLAELERLAELAGAEAEDLADCRRFYTELQGLGHARLARLANASAGTEAVMRERTISRLAYDAQRDVIDDLERTAEIPEEVAKHLRDQLDEALAAELRAASRD